MTLLPRVVVVTRRSELDELVAHHGTQRQAAWFLDQRERDIAEVEERHQALDRAVRATLGAIPVDWRRGTVERADLDRFAFAPEDVVVVVGQDGLVANVAKYLDGQPVIGVDPEPGRNPGVLVAHPAAAVGELLAEAASGLRDPARRDPSLGEITATRGRTMVEAVTDDGLHLLALNEVYVGQPSHQSARYVLAAGGQTERQSSSGLLVGTGTGSTGWCRSVAEERRSALALPAPTEDRLCWFVREAWPSPATGTTLTEGELVVGEGLAVSAESDQLVVFGDGIEHDALRLTWGQRVTVRVAARRLNLVER